MNKSFYVVICLFLIEQYLALSASRNYIYLPMKKDHKYGEDICYYREIDEKLDYAIYYVRPCEKGQYCEDEISGNQPYGFCRDVETNITDFPGFGDSCSTNGECQTDLTCDNSKCTLKCPSSSTQIQKDYNSYYCRPSNYKQFDDNEYCEWNSIDFRQSDPKSYIRSSTIYYGKFPGFPKECGIIEYKQIEDVDPSAPATSPNTYIKYTRYVKQGKKWCSIGEAKDGDFVTNARFCKSNFALKFYPKGDLVDPSYESTVDGRDLYTEELHDMCVTPTQIDLNNPLTGGCVITYKGADGSEHKYNVNKYYTGTPPSNLCDKDILIKSQLYSEFIDEFNNSSEEDQRNCYKIPQGSPSTTEYIGNCQNIKLLKLYYFYHNIEDFLFYKDRKDLEKVLHYKIQKSYHRYYELSNYLSLNHLFFFLILILF